MLYNVKVGHSKLIYATIEAVQITRKVEVKSRQFGEIMIARNAKRLRVSNLQLRNAVAKRWKGGDATNWKTIVDEHRGQSGA